MSLAFSNGGLIFQGGGLGSAPDCCCKASRFCCCTGGFNDFISPGGFSPTRHPRITPPPATVCLTRGQTAPPSDCRELSCETKANPCAGVGILIEWCELLIWTQSAKPNPLPPVPAKCSVDNQGSPLFWDTSLPGRTCWPAFGSPIGGCIERRWDLALTEAVGMFDSQRSLGWIFNACGRCYVFGRVFFRTSDEQSCVSERTLTFFRRDGCDADVQVGLPTRTEAAAPLSGCIDQDPQITITFAP